MENKIETIVAKAAIKSSPEKFFNFFKLHMNDLLKVFPAVYKGVQILEGEDGKVGCVKLWNYTLGTPLTVTVKTVEIDDEAKMIKWDTLGGDVMSLYNSFVLILSVGEGSIEWISEYVGATPTTSPPELYNTFFGTATTVVDNYLLTN